MTNKRSVFSLRGISYNLYMDGDVQVVRENQPCYGELRKYEKTHAGECTQSHNSKPGDLHWPFPDGTPTSLEVPFGTNSYGAQPGAHTDNLFKAFFGPESPWVKGFGTDVQFLKEEGKDYISAIRIPDLAIDPTVLVNSFKNFRSAMARAKDFNDLVDGGLTNNEALAVLMLNGGVSPTMGVAQTGTYSACKIFSPKRFFGQNPNDHTGGLLKDRIDYNRTLMQDPFLGTEADGGFEWHIRAKAEGLPQYTAKAGTVTIEAIVKTAKKIFGEGLDNEKDPVNVPFIWKTTTGKSNEKGDAIALSCGK